MHLELEIVGHSSPGRAPWEGPRGEFRALIRAGRRHRADGKGGEQKEAYRGRLMTTEYTATREGVS